MTDIDYIKDAAAETLRVVGEMALRQAENSERLARIEVHVLGNGSPGMGQRLEATERAVSQAGPAIVHLQEETAELKEEVHELIGIENREHGVLRFLVVGVPMVFGGGTAVAAVIKLLGG